MLSRFLFIPLLLINALAYSQSTLSGSVFDSTSHHNVAYSTVYIEGTTVGTLADYNGNFTFSFPDSLLKRNLIFSMLGYTNYKIKAAKYLSEKINKVQLSPENSQLKTVDISTLNYNKFTEKQVGAIKHKGGKVCYASGNEVAAYMPNEAKKKGYIKALRFYITKDGYPTEPFGIKLYSVDEKTGGPGDNLIDTLLVASAEKGNQWFSIDVLKYYIRFPTDGFYLAMEWLPDSKSKAYKMEAGKDNWTCNGQSLGTAPETSTSEKLWERDLLSGWIYFTNLFNPAIGADVILSNDN